MGLMNVSATINVATDIKHVHLRCSDDSFRVYRLDLVYGGVPYSLTVMNNGDSIFLFDGCADWTRRAAS